MRSAAAAGSIAASSGSSVLAAARSRPAEKARPSPRRTTTRMSPGRSRLRSRRVVQVEGVCALSASGRHNVTVATGPARSHRTPATAVVVTVATYGSGGLAGRTGERRGGSRLLAASRTTALAQLNPGLGEYPVDEAVRAAGRGGKGPDALSGAVSLDEVLRERLTLSSDDPATLFGGGRAGGCHVDSSRPY